MQVDFKVSLACTTVIFHRDRSELLVKVIPTNLFFLVCGVAVLWIFSPVPTYIVKVGNAWIKLPHFVT